MANTFYTPEQAAKVAVALGTEEAYLSALISRNFQNDLFGGGGRGRTVNIKVPTALIGRSRGIDDVTNKIVLDSITEEVESVTLGRHAYSAVGLSEGDLTLDLTNFSAQVLKPQMEAVVWDIEDEVRLALQGIPMNYTIGYDAAAPSKTFTAIRKHLRDNGVPTSNLVTVVGTQVYADLLDAKEITDASQSGSTEALREGNVGKVRGFTVVEHADLEETEIVAFHRDAFTLAVRAPVVPQGAAFGASVSEKGFNLRYLRDYAADVTQDRSIVSTFVGVAAMPFFKVDRVGSQSSGLEADSQQYGTAQVTKVEYGAAFRMLAEADVDPEA